MSQCSTSGGLAGEDDMINFFVCNDAAMTVPYSLVCDFRNDCSDGSDETLCSYADFCLDFRQGGLAVVVISVVVAVIVSVALVVVVCQVHTLLPRF